MNPFSAPPLTAQLSMFFADVRRDLLRRRMVIAAGALAAAVVVSVIAAGTLFSARRRAERDVQRAVSDQAAYGARLLLDEIAQYSRTSLDLLEVATLRGGREAPAVPDTLLARLRWEQVMSLQDSLYVDPLRTAFRVDEPTGDTHWAADSGLPEPAFRNAVVARARRRLHAATPVVDYDVATIAWRGENIAIWFLPARDAAGRLTAIDGVTFSRSRFLAHYVPMLLDLVPILPASVAGARWNVRGKDTSLRLQAQRVSVRFEDIGTGIVEYESVPSMREGAFGTFARTSGDTLGIRVRLGLSDTLTRMLVAGSEPPVSERTLWLLVATAALLGLVAVFVVRRAFAGLSQRQRFLATVSHELRTPLTQVRLSVETLRRLPSDGDERRRRTIEALDRGTEQLTRTVENLLALAKSELPTWRVRQRPTDLEALVRGALDMIAPVAAKRRVTFEVIAPSAVWALVDPDAFRQVILNLLDNAVKYGGRGQSVRVRLRSYNETAEVSIADQGPGIAVEHRARIWQPFERVTDGATASRDGLGLGLSVVRDIVARHNGWVRVEDGIGRGAVFVVGVPAAVPTDVPATTAEYPAAGD